MGSAMMDVMPAGNLSSVTDRSVQEYMDVLSEPSIVKKTRQGFKETNERVLEVTADWYEFLQLLEQNPQNYKSMCRDGDVEEAIAGLEKTGKSMPTERWTAIGKFLKEFDTETYEKFKVVDENIRACSALLREVSWTLLLLHREHQPSTGPSYSIDEAIADLRS